MILCAQCGGRSRVVVSNRTRNSMRRYRVCVSCSNRWATMEISASDYDRMLDRDRRQKAAGKRSGDTRRGFKIPPDRMEEWRAMRSKNKFLSAREMGEILGIVGGQP